VDLSVNTDSSIPAGSRFFLSYTGSPPNGTDLGILATAVMTSWGAHWKQIVVASEALIGVICTDLSSDTGAVGSWSGSLSGTASGTPLPASAAIMVGHRQPRRYRGGQPRTYMRGGVEEDLSGHNQWSPSQISSWQTNWGDFIADIEATSGMSITIQDIVLVSFYTGFNTVGPDAEGRYRYPPKKRDSPLVNNITGSYVAAKVGSQRRRLDI
jgi:hypothetical protein